MPQLLTKVSATDLRVGDVIAASKYATYRITGPAIVETSRTITWPVSGVNEHGEPIARASITRRKSTLVEVQRETA